MPSRPDPVDVIADVLHRQSCVAPEVCKAEPSPENREAASAILVALDRAGLRPAPDGEVDAMVDLLGCIWLYVGWRYVTKQLTTEQRELWADAIELWDRRRFADTSDPDDVPLSVDRWWRA